MPTEMTHLPLSQAPKATPAAEARAPSLSTLVRWENEGGCEATDGCWVEADGHCVHGQPSWLIVLGLI